MLTSSVDFAIFDADVNNTLNYQTRPSRLGGEYIAICDEYGTITVAENQEEAKSIVQNAINCFKVLFFNDKLS